MTNATLQMLDINDEHVEILIRKDGKVVWVNVDGICRLRIQNPTEIVINDERQQNAH